MADKEAGKMLSSDDFVDLFSPEYQENTECIKGIGRGKLKTNIAGLKLPKAATKKKNDCQNTAQFVFGRGRGSARMNAALSNQPARLPRQKQSQQGYLGIHNTSSFPSLQASNVGVSRVSNSPKTSHKKDTKQTITKSDSPWPSLLDSYTTRRFDGSPISQPSYSNSVSSNVMQTPNIDGDDIVVIRNLPEAIIEEDLRELLSLYGGVSICNLERDTQGNSLGSALVRMETSTESEWIISCFNDQEYPGCPGSEKLSCTLLGK